MFSFIKEFQNLKEPPVSHISKYDWKLPLDILPKYPTIKTFKEITAEQGKDSDLIFEVKRPNETQCPQPPEQIKDWINGSWNNLNRDVDFLGSKNISENEQIVRIEKFEESEERVKIKNEWLFHRSQWIDAEKPVRDAIEVFNNLFELHAKLKKEDEKYQLYMSEGLLNWESEKELLNHPILLQKASLKIDFNTPSFTITLESDSEINLTSHILRYHGISGNCIQKTKEHILETYPDITESEKIKGILKLFIHSAFSNGNLVEPDGPNAKNPSIPTIQLSPTLLLAKKSHTFTEMLDKVIDGIQDDKSQPPVLQRIVGIEAKTKFELNDKNTKGRSSIESSKATFEFYQTKPANKEQIRIIQRLEKSGCVLVQGPPGTGKSHTIANLIGHLLAKGKRILVTSHTSKALQVVREKVVSSLQPLCVSNLSSDIENRAQLKDSINGIVSYLSKTDSDELKNKIHSLKEIRNTIKSRCNELEKRALCIQRSEYEEIIVQGETPILPTDAANFIKENEKNNSWIPSPLKQGSPLPLNIDELNFLYKSNNQISSIEDHCLEDGIIDITQLPTSSEIEEISNRKEKISSEVSKVNGKFLKYFRICEVEVEELSKFIKRFETNLKSILDHTWMKKIFYKFLSDKNNVKPWYEFLKQIKSEYPNIISKKNEILAKNPVVSFKWNNELYLSCKELIKHLDKRNKVHKFFFKFL